MYLLLVVLLVPYFVAVSARASLVNLVTTSSPCSPSSFVVSKNASYCEYETITAAVAALPNDGAEKTILVLPGVYQEQISITRNGKVILRGATNFSNDYSQNRVTVEFDDGVDTSADEDETTPVIHIDKSDSTGLALYNIDFVNTFPQTPNYAALAGDFYGVQIAAYGCSFIGFQDTLLANKGIQVFSNCFVSGSVDFIWGFSTAFFNGCKIAANTPGGSISAQSRATSTSPGGYVFNDCYVTYTSTYGDTFGQTYLGRPYSNFSIAVYTNSYLDKNINPLGWSVWETNNPQTNGVMFGEYNNVGPGAWTANTTRASFATNLTASEASAYELEPWVGNTSWIDRYQYNLAPSWVYPDAASVNDTPTKTSLNSRSIRSGSTAASSNSTVQHPRSGTTPLEGATLVSPNGTVANSYSDLTEALASLPNDNSAQTIFVYPGSYIEQFNVDRSGPVTIIGYQEGDVGKTYSANQVVVQYSRGLSVVAPIPSGHHDTETAVLTTTSNGIAFYNVDFINTLNLDGSVPSFVTLAASTNGDQISFYGCSFVGWQDTLLTDSRPGYQYFESCYIEGAIDFIWGKVSPGSNHTAYLLTYRSYAAAYFKGCVIGAKNGGSCITAQSRANLSAVGGYVFDQCLFTAASDATQNLTGQVYLGRPYSEYALVAIKNSYLDSLIDPSGWREWGATDPRLNFTTFVEYNNSGPGDWQNNVAAREAFGYATLATTDPYPFDSFFMQEGTDWIDFTYFDSITVPASVGVNFSSYITSSNTTSGTTGSRLRRWTG